MSETEICQYSKSIGPMAAVKVMSVDVTLYSHISYHNPGYVKADFVRYIISQKMIGKNLVLNNLAFVCFDPHNTSFTMQTQLLIFIFF